MQQVDDVGRRRRRQEHIHLLEQRDVVSRVRFGEIARFAQEVHDDAGIEKDFHRRPLKLQAGEALFFEGGAHIAEFVFDGCDADQLPHRFAAFVLRRREYSAFRKAPNR